MVLEYGKKYAVKLYAVYWYWYWYTVHARSLINYVLSLSIPNFQNVQGVPKNALSWLLAITPLWNGLEIKVGGVLKTSGNSLCDGHNNFPNLPF